MPFPAAPTNGDKTTINGKVYVYNSTDDKWSVDAIAINQVSDTVTATGNVTGGNLVTTGTVFAPTMANGNSNIRIAANANVTVSSTGNANVFIVTGTGANIAGTANITGNLSAGNISGRIAPRVSSTASITSPLAWNSDSFDQYAATAQAGALTINADSGTPVDGQKILFRFKDNGTARGLTWTTGATNAFRAVGVILPTTTVINKTTYVGCIYNAADSRWDAIAVTTET